jgi:hypothetical protein
MMSLMEQGVRWTGVCCAIATFVACGGGNDPSIASTPLKVTAASFKQAPASQPTAQSNASVSPNRTGQTVSADPFKAFLDADKK